MGASVSRNTSTFDAISTSLSENINQSMTQIAQSSVSTANPTQLIRVRVVSKGDINFSNNRQIIVANIDVQKFLSQMSETQLKSLLTTALTATAKENQALEQGLVIGGAYSSNTSKTMVRQQNVNRIVNSYSYSQLVSDASSIFASQVIDIVGNAGGDANITGNTQHITVEILSKQIAKVMMKTFQDIVSESSVEAKKELTQTSKSGFSFSMGQIMVFIVIMLVIIAVVAGIWYFKGGGREMVEKQLART